MKLYEIPQEMEDLIDQETGEVTDPERYMALAREYVLLSSVTVRILSAIRCVPADFSR